MIIDIRQVIDEPLKSLLGNEPYFLTKIVCTKPVFLVMTSKVDFPQFVLKVGDCDSLNPLHERMVQLHQKLGDFVSEPIKLIPLNSTTSVWIQRGLQGIPWFRISQHVPFEQIQEIAVESLLFLHGIVGQDPLYRSNHTPGLSLHQILDKLQNYGTLADPSIEVAIRSSARKLETLGTVESFFQHGDFCINNLIFNNTRACVIDFDDFGLNSAPLHDFFSLWQSLSLFSPHPLSNQSCEELLKRYCNQIQIPQNCIEYATELRLHQICFELLQCVHNAREPYLSVLTKLLQKVIAEQQHRIV